MSNNLTYRLRAGDTLATVARRHGLQLTDLTALNPRINPHTPRPGAAVRLPNMRASASSPLTVGTANAPAAAAPSPAPAKAAPLADVIAMIEDALAPAETAKLAEESAIEVAALEIDQASAVELLASAAPTAAAAASAEEEAIQIPTAPKEDAPPLLVGNFLPGVGAANEPSIT